MAALLFKFVNKLREIVYEEARNYGSGWRLDDASIGRKCRG